MTQGDFRLRIKPSVAAVPALLDAIGLFAEKAGLPRKLTGRLALVCEELAVNVATHGGAGQAASDRRGASFIEFRLARRGDELTVEAEDDGVFFDPLSRQSPDTTLGLDERAIGGLGLHVIRSLVRRIEYRRRGDHNLLVLALEIA